MTDCAAWANKPQLTRPEEAAPYTAMSTEWGDAAL